MSNLTTTQFDTNVFYSETEKYETLYKGKRSQRQKYIMSMAVERFVKNNGLKNPSYYLLYLIADKKLSALNTKGEQYMITELCDELENDIDLFKRNEQSESYEQLLDRNFRKD
jgi:hypothetical protein